MTHRQKNSDRISPPVSSAYSGDQTNEFLTFRLGGEEYGVEILKVQEIRDLERPILIANAPVFIKGVINLRSTIAPIVGMRIKFGFDEPGCSLFTVVIILNVAGRIVGMVVDSVSDVITLPMGQIRPAPEFSSAVDTQYITGLGTVDQQMLVLVNIERLMTSADMALVNGVVH